MDSCKMDDLTKTTILNESANAVVIDQKSQHVEENKANSIQFEMGKTTESEVKQIDEPDCRFTVGPQKREFKGNKLLLSLQSSAFKSMFYGPLKEGNVVDIPDVEPEAFAILLKFIVHEKSVHIINMNHAVKILHLADKYNVTGLIDLTVEYLYPNSVDKMWLALHCGVLYSIPILTEAAMKIVRQETIDVLTSSQFPTISHSLLMVIVRDDYLTVQSELEVFNAVVSWGEFQCLSADMEPSPVNIRKQLGDAIYYIRFLTLPSEEIETSCAFLLTLAETMKIINASQRVGYEETAKPFSSCTVKRKGQTAIDFPVLMSVKFINTPLESFVEAKITETTLKLQVPIILGSVILHSVHNNKKVDQVYLENVTVHVCQSTLKIGEGKFTGLVKYNDCFKVSLFDIDNPAAAPILPHPANHSIEVVFNTKRKELNPPYAGCVKCPFLGTIEGGYVIGVEYCPLTPNMHLSSAYSHSLIPSYIQRSGYPLQTLFNYFTRR